MSSRESREDIDEKEGAVNGGREDRRLSFILWPASLICLSATFSTVRAANMISAHSGKARRLVTERLLFTSVGAGCKQTVKQRKELLNSDKVKHLKALTWIKTFTLDDFYFFFFSPQGNKRQRERERRTDTDTNVNKRQNELTSNKPIRERQTWRSMRMSDSQASLKPQVPTVTSSATSDIIQNSNSNTLSQGSGDYTAKGFYISL